MAQGIPKYWKSFRRWLSSPLGKALIREETRQLSGLLSKLFGYHVLLMGEAEFAASLEASLITHRVWVHPFVEAKSSVSEQDQARGHLKLPSEEQAKSDCKDRSPSPLCSRLDKLAVLSDEIDLVYLAHCLENIKNPHEVLREAYRVIRPEGHLIITCFNPFSLWSIWRWSIGLFKRPAWDGKFISAVRLKDWLALLGFDVLQVRHCFFKPPFQHEKVMEKLTWMENFGKMLWPFSGASIVILAKKRVLTLTPVFPKAMDKRKVLAPGIVEPVARSD